MTTTINASTSSGLVNTADTSGILQLQTASTAALTIDASQNVGIGITSPTRKLAVSGTWTNTGDYLMDSADPQLAWSSGTLRFKYGGLSGTEAMRIDSSGNVGIGTASPSTYSAKLAVVASSGVANQWLVGGASSGAYAYFSNNAQSSTANTMQIGQGWTSGSDNIGFLNTNGANPMLFATNGAERMRILSGGQVSVATTTNLGGNFNVDCTNSSTFSAYIKSNTSGGAVLGVNAVNPCSTHVQWYNSGTPTGSVTWNGASAVAYNTTSDYRLKENIAPMTGALAKVAQLKPVTYKWKLDGADGQGFIAHELAEVVPDCVNGEKDAVDADGNPVYQGIDTSFLVATLTAAIQELKAINDTQAETINALTARIVALESKA